MTVFRPRNRTEFVGVSVVSRAAYGHGSRWNGHPVAPSRFAKARDGTLYPVGVSLSIPGRPVAAPPYVLLAPSDGRYSQNMVELEGEIKRLGCAMLGHGRRQLTEEIIQRFQASC